MNSKPWIEMTKAEQAEVTKRADAYEERYNKPDNVIKRRNQEIKKERNTKTILTVIIVILSITTFLWFQNLFIANSVTDCLKETSEILDTANDNKRSATTSIDSALSADEPSDKDSSMEVAEQELNTSTDTPLCVDEVLSVD